MKSLLLAFALLLGLSSATKAQMRDHHAERYAPADRTTAAAEQLTRQMSQRLKLNEAQIIQLRAVNKIKLARAEEIGWLYEQEITELAARLGELEAQYELECSRILTPSQLSLFRSEQKPETAPSPPSTEGGLG